jgi:hypothetical protein
MTLKWAEMTPRERDALVAEKVMGFVVHPHGGVWDGKNPATYRTDFHPSTDISAAWEVVEKFKNGPRDDAYHSFYDNATMSIYAITPERICLAALKAVGVDID